MPPETARQVAEKEAAKQAVALVFGVAGIVILLALQRKWSPLQQVLDQADPSGASQRRMSGALAAKRRWTQVADYLWRVRLPGWRTALSRAQAAHESYERERP